MVERNEAFLKEKNLKLKTAQIIDNYEYTFAPKINKNSNNYRQYLEVENDNKSNNINTIEDKERERDMERDNSPSKKDSNVNSVINHNNNNNSHVGERLYNYQNIYKKNIEEKTGTYKENYSFKPEISKNTHEILRKRDLELEEVKRRIDEKEKLKAQIMAKNQQQKHVNVNVIKNDNDMNNEINNDFDDRNNNKISLNSLREEY